MKILTPMAIVLLLQWIVISSRVKEMKEDIANSRYLWACLLILEFHQPYAFFSFCFSIIRTVRYILELDLISYMNMKK